MRLTLTRMHTFCMLAVLVVTTLACTPTPTNEIRLPADAMPYIWWYADSENAFVVERADGSDSRLIGKDVLPDEHDKLEDTAFSPSGEWFAWRSAERLEGRYGEYSGFLVHVADDVTSDVLSTFTDIRMMAWSPTEDWLFIANRVDTYDEILSIIDVTSGDVLVEVRLHFAPEYGWYPYHQNRYGWSEDSQFFYYDAGGYRYDLHVDGSVDVYHWQQLYSWNNVFVLPYEFTDEGYAVLENTQTGQQIPLYEAPDYDVDNYLYVSPTRMHVLNIAHPSTGREIHLIDIEAETVSRLSDELSVLSEEIMNTRPVWSPDGQLAILVDDDEIPHLLDISTGNITEITLPEDSADLEHWYWVMSERTIFIVTSDSELYLYAIDSDEIRMLEADIENQYDSIAPELYPSPDGRYLGFRYRTDTLLDLDTDETQYLPSHNATMYQDSSSHLIEWHEDSEWFFTSQMTIFAGGGGYTSRSLRHIDGRWRELGHCAGDCIGFVPVSVLDNLPEGEATSAVQAPLVSILHEGNVRGVAWHPTDQQIVVFEYVPNRDDWLTFWDVSDINNPEQIGRYTVDIICGEFPIGCRLIWQDDETVIVSESSVDTFDIPSGTVVEIAAERDWSLSPNGQFDYVLEDDVMLINSTEDDTTVAELPTDSDELRRYHSWWASDGASLLVTDDYENRLYFWSGGDFREIEYTDLIYEIDYLPSIDLLVGGSMFQRITLWDLPTDEVYQLNWTAQDMAFNHDGTYLAAVGTRYVTLWDMSRFHE